MSSSPRGIFSLCLALGVPPWRKTDNGPAYVSKQLKTFFQQWGVKHSTGIPHLPTGQSVVERTHQNIKRVLHQQWGGKETLPPVESLCKALCVINFLNCSNSERNPPVTRHFSNSAQAKLEVKPPVLIKDPETHQISGPFQLITWAGGYAGVSTSSGPKWLAGKNIKPYLGPANTAPTDNNQIISKQDAGSPKMQFCMVTMATSVTSTTISTPSYHKITDKADWQTWLHL